MAEYVDFRYMPLEGKITGKQVLKQTEDAINDLGQHVYEIDIDNEKIQEAIDTSNQAIETAEEALAVVTTNRAVWYNSVTELREAIIDNGIVAAIKGYAFAGDEGQAFYVVREKKAGDIDDGKTIIFLDAGNVAEIIANTGITNMFDFDEDGYLSQIVDGDISNQYGEKKRLASYEGQQEIVEAFNDVINASLDIKGNAESARNSAEIASNTMTQLLNYLDTKEEITAPIVDPTLTISGAAADSKIVGNTIKYATDVTPINIEHPGYYLKTENGVIDVSNPLVSGSGYGYVVVSCSAGDTFTVSGVSSNSYPMAWAFTDSSYNVIQQASSNVTYTDYQIQAPTSSAYLIIHDKTPYRMSYKGLPVYDGAKELAVIFNDITGNIPYSNYMDGSINTRNSPVNINAIVDSSYKHIVIPCVAGDSFTVTGKTLSANSRLYAFISSDGTILQNADNLQLFNNDLITAPTNTAYLVVNQYAGSDPNGIPTKVYKGTYLKSSVAKNKTEIDSIIGVKDCLIKSANLIDESTIKPGYISTDGSIAGTSSGTYSYFENYISVSYGDTVYLNHSARFVCAYNADKIAVSVSGAENVSTYSVPNGISFIRLTFSTSVVSDGCMANTGTGLLPYQPYGSFIKYSRIDNAPNTKKYEDALGHTQKIVTEASLSNDSLTISDFPISLKKGIAMSFYGEFEAFNTITIGRGGSDVNYSKYFEITSEKIIKHIGGESTVEQVYHGLTISTFLMCNIFFDLDKIFVNIFTFGGSYSHEFTADGNTRGDSFVTVAGSVSNIKLTCECGDLQKPLWLFGDSYLSTSSTARVGYYLKQMGFTNYAMFAYPGMSPTTGISELNKAKVFGTPKFIVWMLGMNGSDSDAISAINSLIDYATENDITIILTKIPSVPEYRHTTLNAYITASGYRYVDSYNAMGCDGNGNTYVGYLSSDDVHPTALGANSIAMRTLVDAPELMLYGRKTLL